MKVLIPENSLLWSPNGFCFPGDIEYGTEIFILNSEKKLAPYVVMDELEKPEQYLTNTLLSTSYTSTLIPNYKTQLDDELVEVNSLKISDPMPLINKNFLEDYLRTQPSLDDKSKISTQSAKFLALTALNENRRAVEFTCSSDNDTKEVVKDLHSLKNEFNATIRIHRHSDSLFKIYFESEKFYVLRKGFDLKSDQTPNSIYTNGFNLLVVFLNFLLLDAGYVNHLNFTHRGFDKYEIFKIHWYSKLRKLIQNTAIFLNGYQLIIYKSKEHRAINELKLERNAHNTLQIILDIKKQKLNCYEIDIPFGSQIIIDNMIIKAHDLNDIEKSELSNFAEKINGGPDFAALRKKIAAGGDEQPKRLQFDGRLGSSWTTKKLLASIPIPPTTIAKLNELRDDKYKISVIGEFDRKGEIAKSKTRFGITKKVQGFLHDDTGEIKCLLWGNIVDKIENGHCLELTNAWTKNGILQNSKKGKEKIHDR